MCAFQTMFGIILIANSVNGIWEIRLKIYPFEATVNVSTLIHWIYINTNPQKKKTRRVAYKAILRIKISMRITGLEQNRILK